MDLSKTIQPKSDQLNADDLIGGSKIIKITSVKEGDSEQQPVSIYFEGDNGKPYKPSLGMRRVLVAIWGKNGKDYVGRSLQLYRENSVKFGGVEVGGIRISHVSHIEAPTRVLETVSKGKRRPLTIEVLKTAPKSKALTDERFVKALEALAEGKTTVEKLKEYDLSQEQLETLTYYDEE